jgi:hypothetical protein
MSRLGVASQTVAPPELQTVQRSAKATTPTHGSAGGRVRSLVDEALRSEGRPLDPETIAVMERGYGHRFKDVRVHTDSRAAAAARSLGANAFTAGRDIVFAPNRYSPNSGTGKRLLAHELAHVVQQSQGPVAGRNMGGGLSVSHPNDVFEREADALASRVASGEVVTTGFRNRAAAPTSSTDALIQRETDQVAPMSGGSSKTAPVTWARGPLFGAPLELPEAEAAVRVNAALDVMTGLTYIRRPPLTSPAIAAAEGSSSEESTVAQTERDPTLQLEAGGSPLTKVHGGVVGSVQVCWDCLTGKAGLKGWIWAGVGYDAPFVGWVGGYYFREKEFWSGDLGKWFEPGACDPACDAHAQHEEDTKSGFGIAGFPVNIKPRERVRLSKAGLEVGFLLTPHSLCDLDLELIALLNLLGYFGPVAKIATTAVDGLNRLTRNAPHFELEAGIDLSASFHLCGGKNGLLAVNRAEFCGGGYVGCGVGLSHTKSENHGAAP